MTNVTRIGEAAPPDSPRHHADGLRAWADKIDAGEVQSVALVTIYGDRLMHISVTRIAPDDDEAFIKLLAGAKLMEHHLAQRVTSECMGTKTVFELDGGAS